jgi:RNA polymerase sigma-70 factor, ECF subfamily
MTSKSVTNRGSIHEFAELDGLFKEHEERLLRMLQARIDPRLSARLGAEAILQEAYLRGRRRWSSYDPSSIGVYPWLAHIALDCLLEAWRREHPDRQLPWPGSTLSLLGSRLADPGSGPLSHMIRVELQDTVREALATLEDDERQVLWLIAEGMKHREAAYVLDVSVEAASKRYYRALKKFRSALPDSLKSEMNR